MRFSVLVVVLLLTACATGGNSIVSYVEEQNTNKRYRSFTVVAKDIPAFLGPVVVSNFSVALAARGLQPMPEGGELTAELRFEQEDLTVDRAVSDFDERISPGGDVRFVAKIVVELTDTRTGEMVYSAGVHRLHDISPGEYMHTGRASLAFLDAFHKALADYPLTEPSNEY